MNQMVANERCDWFLSQFENVGEAVNVMLCDMDEFKIFDTVASKMLRLASCPSSPVGERTNAARAAYKRIATYFN